MFRFDCLVPSALLGFMADGYKGLGFKKSKTFFFRGESHQEAFSLCVLSCLDPLVLSPKVWCPVSVSITTLLLHLTGLLL